MIRKHYDKILLGLALVIFLAIFALLLRQPEIKSTTGFTALRPDNTYEVSAMPEVELEVPEWEPVGPQSAGVEWTFDLFTPPVIYFNPRNESFTVLPVTAPPPPPWPVELVTVREELYRIQLRGWIGDKGDYRINLNVQRGNNREFLLAREGEQYGDFTVRSFRVEQSSAGGTVVGTAVIYDELIDREMILSSTGPTFSEESTAYFRSKNDPDRQFRVGEGESFSLAGYSYTVEEILPPVRVRLRRSGGDSEPETQTFVALEPEGASVPAGGRSAGDAREPGSTGAGEKPDF